MRTHNIPSCYRKVKEILIMPPDLTLLSTLIGLNYPCLQLIFMVPKVFEPLKFDCILWHLIWVHSVCIHPQKQISPDSIPIYLLPYFFGYKTVFSFQNNPNMNYVEHNV